MLIIHRAGPRYNISEVNIAKFFRGIAVYLLGTALFFTLFLLAYFFVFSRVTANPDQVKSILRNSGAYHKIPEVIYDNSVDSNSTTSASIPLKSPLVRQAALDSFNPDFVQKNIENVIDGTYDWLGGQSNEPKFEVNLKEVKDNFAKSLSESASRRLKDLPVCSAKQMQKIKEIDAFSSPCLLPGTDVNKLKKQVLAAAKGSDNFLKETKISPSTFKDSDGQPVFDNYPDIPQAYQLGVKMPYILAVLCILMIAGLVFMHDKREEGLTQAGKLLAAAGVLIAFIPFLINHLANGILRSGPDDKVVAELAMPIVHEFAKTAGKFYFIAAAIYILLAAAAFYLAWKISENKTAKKGKN